MPVSKFKEAFNGAASAVKRDFKRSVITTASVTGVMGLTAAFTAMAVPPLPFVAAGAFVAYNLLTGANGAYESLFRYKS
jgi:hypothetical protein